MGCISFPCIRWKPLESRTSCNTTGDTRPMLNISRIDHEPSSTHAWRVQVRRQSRYYRRDFGDGRHGGTEPALATAITYRDQIIAAHPPLAMPKYRDHLETNRSGVSGLRRVDRLERSKGRSVVGCWEAEWPIDGCRAKHRKFSILKYGEKAAFEMAVAARQTALEALAADTFSPFAAYSGRRTRSA